MTAERITETALAEAFHGQFCIAYEHPGPNAPCDRLARIALPLFAAHAEAVLTEAAEDVDLDLGAGFTGADDQAATTAAEHWLVARAQREGGTQ